MELYIKKAKITTLDKYEITDKEGNVIYDVRGELLSNGKRLRINDPKGFALAEVFENKLVLRDVYVIKTRSSEVDVYKIDTMRKVPEYRAKQIGWTLKGDFSRNDIKIMEGLNTIAHIKPKAFSFGETMKMDVAIGQDAMTALALYLVSQIDRSSRPENATEK